MVLDARIYTIVGSAKQKEIYKKIGEIEESRDRPHFSTSALYFPLMFDNSNGVLIRGDVCHILRAMMGVTRYVR